MKGEDSQALKSIVGFQNPRFQGELSISNILHQYRIFYYSGDTTGVDEENLAFFSAISKGNQLIANGL